MKYKTWVFLKTLIIVVSVLAALSTIFIAYRYEKREKDILDEKSKKLDALTIDLRKERMAIDSEIVALRSKISGDGFDYGSVSFLISEPIVSAYYNVVPLIESYNMKGMIAVNPSFFEKTGYMSTVMLLDLYNKGWEVVINLDKFESLEFLVNELTELGITCHSAYFSLSTKYKVSYDEELLSYGINNVIVYSGVSQIRSDSMFEIMAYGSNDTGCKSMLFNAVSGSKPIIYTIGFNDTRERYTEGIVTSMIKYMKQAFDKEDATLDNTTVMKEKYEKYYDEWQNSIEPCQERIDELKIRLVEISDEIKRIKKENNL